MEKMERKRAHKIFTAEDLLLAKKDGKTWIARGNKVYDVTDFVADHPGGDDLITQFAGQVIDGKMEDVDSHEHSPAAYAVLDEYLVGRLASDAGLTVSEGAFIADPLTFAFCSTAEFGDV